MQKLSATLILSMLLLASCQAGNVGRQRRVHTSATSTGANPQLAGFGLPLWHATYASNDEYIETPFKRAEVIAPRSHQQQEPQLAENSARSAQGLDLFDLLPAAEVTPVQLQQLLLGAPAANVGQMRLLGAGHEQAGEGRFLGKTVVIVVPVGSGNNSAASDAKNITITNTNTNINNSTTPASSSTGTTTRFVPIDSLRTQALPLQYFQTRRGQDTGANLVALNAGAGLQLPYNLMDFNQAGYTGGYAGGYAGGAVPLVPVTLGNNAVGYVPLNLRMFRQLVDGAALPIRESEEDAALPMEAIVEPELESEPEISEDVAPAAQKAAGSRFQLFAQRLRQRPVVSVAPAVAAAATATAPTEFAIRNPFLSFKNLRRVQYV